MLGKVRGEGLCLDCVGHPEEIELLDSSNLGCLGVRKRESKGDHKCLFPETAKLWIKENQVDKAAGEAGERFPTHITTKICTK